MQLTPAQAFHHRWAGALAAADTATLAELYHPQAVKLEVGTGRTLLGAASIATGYAELFGVTGAITTTSTESFNDAGGAYVAESVHSTGIAQQLSYDVFALDAGRALFHVSGSITPRPPSHLPAGSTSAPGQQFYRRMWEALSSHDAGAVAALYAPNAVQITPDGVVTGGQAIVQRAQHSWQQGVRAQLKGLSAFVEGPEAIAVEGVVNMAGMDLMFYEAWLLRAGRAVLNVRGLISPRPAELRANVQKMADNAVTNMQILALSMTRRW